MYKIRSSVFLFFYANIGIIKCVLTSLYHVLVCNNCSSRFRILLAKKLIIGNTELCLLRIKKITVQYASEQKQCRKFDYSGIGVVSISSLWYGKAGNHSWSVILYAKCKMADALPYLITRARICRHYDYAYAN